MGHQVNPEREYRLLQQRLDRNVTGAPDAPEFIQILKLLCTPEEAAIALRVPSRLMSLKALARRVGMPPAALDDTLTRLAERGLVIDLAHAGERYFMLAPVVIGFFEFTFMRAPGGDLPLPELARLFETYMLRDDRFARAVFSGDTQIGRAMVREETLPEDDFTEVLDWERATHAIRSARSISLSFCSCRHEAEHLGRACSRPQETCLSFNIGAETLIGQGFGRAIDQAEALDVLARAKDSGLMQTGDNVQRRMSYLCNCCGCCCNMIAAIRRFDIRNAIVTSNWIMAVDERACVGCGKCISTCPVGAIAVRDKLAARDAALCLGCGVCVSACPVGALAMQPRPQRVYTPETTFDRIVTMAIERGKLADLIFDDHEQLSHRALGRIVSVLEHSPPVQAALAIEPLRSTFLRVAVKGAHLMMGAVAGDV